VGDPSTLTTLSEAETGAAGRDLAATLGPGSVVLLFGDLGAGKTAFVRGMAEGLGVDPEDVTSPTFTLLQEYRGGRLPLFHADLYRLNDGREVEELGLEELAADGVLAIEWSEKLPRTPAQAIRVSITDTGQDQRSLTIEMHYSDR
jgi:tRNA threonylcarbamoyladenosine biosynthesis protein TsaE